MARKTKKPKKLASVGEADFWSPMPPDLFYRQVAKLKNLYPTNTPVRYTYGRPADEDIGSCYQWFNDDGSLSRSHTYIDDRLQRVAAIPTLLHEHAHVLHAESLGTRAEVQCDIEQHPPEFYAIFGELERSWWRTKPLS